MIVSGVERPRVNWGSVFMQTLRKPAVLECFGLFSWFSLRRKHVCGALALVKSEERVWMEQERTGDTRSNSQDLTLTAVLKQLQLAPCVPHQAIIKAGLISKTQDLESQKLLATFLCLMFYPIKRFCM